MDHEHPFTTLREEKPLISFKMRILHNNIFGYIEKVQTKEQLLGHLTNRPYIIQHKVAPTQSLAPRLAPPPLNQPETPPILHPTITQAIQATRHPLTYYQRNPQRRLALLDVRQVQEIRHCRQIIAVIGVDRYREAQDVL